MQVLATPNCDSMLMEYNLLCRYILLLLRRDEMLFIQVLRIEIK